MNEAANRGAPNVPASLLVWPVPRSRSVALNQSVADRSRIEAIVSQSAASCSHASLSSGLKALSGRQAAFFCFGAVFV